MQAYQQRKENGWSAVDTAIYIETHGYKVPALLMEMARKEVKDGESDKVKAVAYDPEELDRRASGGARNSPCSARTTYGGETRAVNLTVDGGGFGDVAADGSLNDINLTAQFADDEIPDDEVNNLLYGAMMAAITKRSITEDPRWQELVKLYRYDWVTAAEVLFNKIPTAAGGNYRISSADRQLDDGFLWAWYG